jgi:uncharacterized protein (TIGR02271 family)
VISVLAEDKIESIIGQDIYGSDGDKIGSVTQVYADDQTGKPEWVSVRTGLFGMKETFVPLADAALSGNGLSVPYEKAFVKDAPNMDEDGHLTPEQERQLYDYYGRTDYDTDERGYGRADGVDDVADRGGRVDRQTGTGTYRDRRDDASTDRARAGAADSGRTSDDAMTVSEERLDVDTERRETGRARLRKYVVTENVTQTVPVQREEVRLEREPITDGNADDAFSGPELSEAEHEVVLHEEQPVVQKETVPVERVRLDTETVTDERQIDEQVSKERVDVEGDVPGGNRA